MLNYLRLLLLPFSFLYGLIIILRNKAYDFGILKSKGFEIPTIVVGNLAVGGTGKSPMTEYLIRMLMHSYKVATLSRGYGRKTKGFLLVENHDDPMKVGDEPLQFKRKYPEITVAVCEDRVVGVEKLKNDHDLVILDDAFQHRALKPGFSILLLEYKSLFKPKFLLPAGNFRDTFSQRKRADIIVISKSPENISEDDKQKALNHLHVSFNQKVVFSYLKYGKPYALNTERANAGKDEVDIHQDDEVVVVTGIANPTLLVEYLKTKVKEVHLLKYPDHYQYTKQDIKKISAKLESINHHNKRIITTEKDAQRFNIKSLSNLVHSLPIVVLPIETAFSASDHKILSEEVIKFCTFKNKN
jgi:tetraacyldisaccharide 4'-kinase